MVLIAQAALWVWIPFAVLIFAYVKPRRKAVLIAYFGAWMFLPMYSIKLQQMGDLSKVTAASYGVLLGAMLFDFKTLAKFRPKWYDLPILLYCFAPYFTSTQNGLGEWDGMSAVSIQIATWGIPYFIGRCYFNTWESFRELGIAVLIGGLIYVPFCLVEIKMSPQLHKMLYGFHAHSFAQEKRWGGFRPQVFMQSGLAVAMWMTAASVAGVWMWVSGTIKKIWGIPLAWLLPILLGTTILCKSSGSLVFLLSGLATLFWIKYVRNPLPLLVLVAIPPVYMYQRVTQNWDGEWLKAKATEVFGADRGQSLATRIDAENLLTARALDAPNKWFGWGKWDPTNPQLVPWRIQAESIKQTPSGEQYIRVRDLAPTDGLWVITLGQFGLCGLIGLTLTILLPPLILLMRAPMKLWDHPMVGAAAAMGVLVALHMSDDLFNGMVNPIFLLSAGGISAIGPSLRKLKAMPRAMPASAAPPGGLSPGALAPGVVRPGALPSGSWTVVDPRAAGRGPLTRPAPWNAPAPTPRDQAI